MTLLGGIEGIARHHFGADPDHHPKDNQCRAVEQRSLDPTQKVLKTYSREGKYPRDRNRSDQYTNKLSQSL